jgi:hypothetical protein
MQQMRRTRGERLTFSHQVWTGIYIGPEEGAADKDTWREADFLPQGMDCDLVEAEDAADEEDTWREADFLPPGMDCDLMETEERGR